MASAQLGVGQVAEARQTDAPCLGLWLRLEKTADVADAADVLVAHAGEQAAVSSHWCLKYQASQE